MNNKTNPKKNRKPKCPGFPYCPAGGGAAAIRFPACEFSRCAFRHNLVRGGVGGALYALPLAEPQARSGLAVSDIEQCQFERNRATAVGVTNVNNSNR